MLILREDNEGQWEKHTYRGKDIDLKIRPFTAEIGDSITKNNTRTEWVRDPVEKKMVKVQVEDKEATFKETVDYVLEDFKGIGFSEEKPLEVNVKNKVRVALLAPKDGEQPLWQYILEKAQNLAFNQGEEIKNL
jgi:hypothetical protein